MREILFRGKRVEEPIKIKHYAPDGWVYGELITGDDVCCVLPKDISGEMYIDRPYKFRANDVEARVMLAKVDESTLGQYTGLKDKNGTKIFEGDIVDCGGYFDKLQVVKWDKEWCAFQPIFDASPIEVFPILNKTEVIEVIGNIYDNPEILGGGEFNG